MLRHFMIDNVAIKNQRHELMLLQHENTGRVNHPGNGLKDIMIMGIRQPPWLTTEKLREQNPHHFSFTPVLQGAASLSLLFFVLFFFVALFFSLCFVSGRTYLFSPCVLFLLRYLFPFFLPHYSSLFPLLKLISVGSTLFSS